MSVEGSGFGHGDGYGNFGGGTSSSGGGFNSGGYGLGTGGISSPGLQSGSTGLGFNAGNAGDTSNSGYGFGDSGYNSGGGMNGGSGLGSTNTTSDNYGGGYSPSYGGDYSAPTYSAAPSMASYAFAPVSSYGFAAPPAWNGDFQTRAPVTDISANPSSFGDSPVGEDEAKFKDFMASPFGRFLSGVGKVALSTNPVGRIGLGLYNAYQNYQDGNVGQSVAGLGGLFGNPVLGTTAGLVTDAMRGVNVSKQAGGFMGSLVGSGMGNSPASAALGGMFGNRMGSMMGGSAPSGQIGSSNVQARGPGMSSREAFAPRISQDANGQTLYAKNGTSMDYSLPMQGSGQGLQLPSNPNLDYMGGGQGATGNFNPMAQGGMQKGTSNMDWVAPVAAGLGSIYQNNRVSNLARDQQRAIQSQLDAQRAAFEQQQQQMQNIKFNAPSAPHFRQTNLDALRNKLGEMFTTDGATGQQLRQMLDRKDAAAGRRSQYGPREVALLSELTRLRAQAEPSYLNSYINSDNQYNTAQQGAYQAAFANAQAQYNNQYNMANQNYLNQQNLFNNQMNGLGAQFQSQAGALNASNDNLGNYLQVASDSGLLNWGVNQLGSLYNNYFGS